METAQRSGLVAALLALGLIASCAGPSTPAVTTVASNDAPVAPLIVETPPSPIEIPPPPPAFACSTTAMQGGAIMCRAEPGAEISLDGKPVATAGEDGIAIVGLRRDAPAVVQVSARSATHADVVTASVNVQTRTDAVSQFPMDCNKIAPQSKAEKRHAEVAWLRKDKAMKLFDAPLAPFGLVKPADGPYSSVYGTTRTYVPKTKGCEGSTSVHNGQDIAIPTGTEIHAPMAGTVILADPDLYYEGGAVFLDLGRGLVSITMHMSRIDVKDGDTIAQGQLLGLSGATGRVTGPHLHWGIKFRNVHSDDRGTDIWLDPMLMLDLKPPA